MIEEAERFEAALDSRCAGAGGDSLSPSMRALVDLAVEIAAAYSGWGLGRADRDRIYAETLRLSAGADRRRWAHLAGSSRPGHRRHRRSGGDGGGGDRCRRAPRASRSPAGESHLAGGG